MTTVFNYTNTRPTTNKIGMHDVIWKEQEANLVFIDW